jgi:hypothetical protein
MSTFLKLTRKQLAIIADNDPVVIKAFEDFFAALNALGAHAATHEPGGSDPLAVDAAPAVGSLRTLGTGAQKAAAGIHAATHVTGGGDVVADAVPAGNSGLMSGADKTKLDALGGPYAPLPQTAAGVGQVQAITSAPGGALSLPAGGTWYYECWYYTTATLYIFSTVATAQPSNGIAAGGTAILAGGAGSTGQANIWRIA